MDNGIVDKDKNIYFLHIAGNGGRALKEYVLNPLLNKKANVVGKHDGWSDFINDDTYIICILRDPVKHACGFYLHFIYKKEYGSDIKSLFLEYYRNTKQMYNFQSQNIIFSGQNYHYGKGEHFNKNIIDIDADLLNKRISRIDLLISQDMLLNDIEYVANTLAEDLDLNRISFEEVSKTKYANSMSSELYKSLTEEEKQEIQNLNNIDYKIYSQLRLEEIKKRGDYKN